MYRVLTDLQILKNSRSIFKLVFTMSMLSLLLTCCSRVAINSPKTDLSVTTLSTTLPLVSISCPSTNRCAALDASGGTYFLFNNKWSKKLQIKGILPNSAFRISCTQTFYCVVVAGEGYGNPNSAGSVSFYINNKWSHAIQISNVTVPQASCVTSSFCMVVDANNKYYILSDGSITNEGQIPLLDIYDAKVNSLDCVESNYCLASDSYGNLHIYKDSTWTVYKMNSNIHINQPGASSISCSDTNYCMILQNNDKAIIWDDLRASIIRQSSGSFTFSGLSCFGRQNCVVTSTRGNVWLYSNGILRKTITLDNLGNNVVRCTNLNFCVAVNWSGKSYEFKFNL